MGRRPAVPASSALRRRWSLCPGPASRSFVRVTGEEAPVCNAIMAISEAAGGRPALQVSPSKAAICAQLLRPQK